jgi:mannose-6-phosphate isomerase-like protein (cupin superfamily)
MPHFDIPSTVPQVVAPGIRIRTAWGERIMLSFLDFESAGATVPLHRHDHEQMGMGLEGEFELVIGGEARLIRAGDVYLVPSGVEHSATAVGGPARALDIFSPPREEYKSASGQ